MKSFIAFSAILLITLSFSCRQEKRTGVEGSALSRIEFESTIYEYGDIPYGSDGQCSFTFRNTSEVPLIVNIVRTSCGCTSPEWPSEPVEPGSTGTISVKYNTSIPGNFYKSITVYCNAENSPIKLFVKGNVAEKPDSIQTQ